MKLIDADELLDRIKNSDDHWGVWNEENIHDIEVAKTVNAIPTEFINNLMQTYINLHHEQTNIEIRKAYVGAVTDLTVLLDLWEEHDYDV